MSTVYVINHVSKYSLIPVISLSTISNDTDIRERTLYRTLHFICSRISLIILYSFNKLNEIVNDIIHALSMLENANDIKSSIFIL